MATLGDFHSTKPVAGLTHGFYRYPATTSPDLVRELLLRFSKPGDWVLDPFMGGGTTIVEALANGRRAVGSDLSSLATFITRVKTTPLTASEWDGLWEWLENKPMSPGCAPVDPPNGRPLPSPLHKPVGRALARLADLQTARQRNLARCALLRTAHWAVEASFVYPRRVNDRRNMTPTLRMLQTKLENLTEGMERGMSELLDAAKKNAITKRDMTARRLLFKASAETLLPRPHLAAHRGQIPLVITSPPYPGVHVLYHRWQIRGRQETSAPFWIAGKNDGMGLSHYTMGGRHRAGLDRYFPRLEGAFRTIRPLLTPEATVIQLVAFNDADHQLPRFLEAMKRAGYVRSAGARPLVRDVPNRRWYARGNELDAGREYLLFHRPKN